MKRLPFFTDLLALHQAHPQLYPFLLETSQHPISQSDCEPGFDILFAFPGETILWDESDGFLNRLDETFAQLACAQPDTAQVPFAGGWFLYLSYELAQEIEPSLSLPHQGRQGPLAFATRCPAAIIRDHRHHCLWLVAEENQPDVLAQMESDLLALQDTQIRPDAIAVQARLERAPEKYLQAVNKIHQYIQNGDVFQVNLSRPWTFTLPVSIEPWQLYAKLRETNPAPFSGIAVIDGFSIISSSPERLVRVKNGVVETRPIAGTRPRGASTEVDQQLQKQLLQDCKERAEHVMLIDLERNDLGRISVPGSVKVTELMAVETYAHVHHIVSNVQGKLVDGVTPGQVIRAMFPGGTITGCPKVRCMEIIAELEQEARGAYTGSMGYLNRDGSMDLNILIRTFTLAESRLDFRAGAGIVQDSIAEKELAETAAKAKGLLAVFSAEL